MVAWAAIIPAIGAAAKAAAPAIATGLKAAGGAVATGAKTLGSKVAASKLGGALATTGLTSQPQFTVTPSRVDYSQYMGLSPITQRYLYGGM